ncbi:MAG: type II secretion system protein GspL [Desulfobacterales bacterium]|jgi:hypothetical protein|nr:type II secretion system protein GspL [Desulfobacterales bacterium]
MSRKYLGLDIQEDALSAVLLQSGLKTRLIESCIQIPLPAAESFPENIQEAFKTLVAAMPLDGPVTTLSIPIQYVTCRNLDVPFSDSKKIRQVLPFELEPRLPFPVEDLVIDFQKVKTTGDITRILAVAAEVFRIKPLLDIPVGYQLDPETVLPGAYGVGCWLSGQTYMPEDWILLDVSNQRCGMVVVCKRTICLLRSFPVLLSSPNAFTAIGGHIQQTMTAMDGILQTAYLPTRLVLTGAGAENDTLHACLSEKFGISVQKLNLLEELNLTQALPSTNSPHRMNNALAGALIAADGYRGGLNLRQGVLAAKSRLYEYKSLIFRTCILGALAIICALAGILSDIFILEGKANQLTAQVTTLFKSTLPNIQKIVDPVHQLTMEIEAIKKKALTPEISHHYLPAIDMLLYLSREIPETLDVHFTSLVAGDQSLLISGTTDSFNAVNEMTQKIEKNPVFKSIKINSANMDPNGNRVRFKIRVQL